MSSEKISQGFDDIKFEPLHKHTEDRGYVYSDGSHAWRVLAIYHLDTIVDDESSVPRYIHGETEGNRINRYRAFVEQKFTELRKFGIDTKPTFINHPVPEGFVKHNQRLQFSHDLRDSFLAVAKIEKPIKYDDLPIFKKRKAISLYIKTYEALYQYLIAAAGKLDLTQMRQPSDQSIFWDIGKIEQYALVEENGTLRLKLIDIDPYLSRGQKRRTHFVDSCIASLEKIKTMADTQWLTRTGDASKIPNLISLFKKEKPYWTLV